MAVFFNPSDINKLKKFRIVIDTNILAICSADEIFLQNFLDTFSRNIRLIDPIIKLEFLRGAKTDSLFEKKKKFLEFNGFYDMPDHYAIYNKVKEHVFDIARIYAHHNIPDIHLGDLLITARLMYYCEANIFATLDQQDFKTLLFDRWAVVSIESSPVKSDKKSTSLEHVVLLQFNEKKFKECLKKLKI